MIYEIEMYSGSCDNCKADYQDEETGFVAMTLPSDIWDCMSNDGWIQDGKKHYCPDCWKMNDEDEIIINESRSKA